MSFRSVSRAFSPVGRFFAATADTIGRARKAQDIMNRSDSYFANKGITREQAIRRVMDF